MVAPDQRIDQRNAAQGLLQLADLFSQPHEERNQDQGCRNQDDVFTKIILGGMLEKLARNGSGNRRQGQKPQKQAFILALLEGQVRVQTTSFGKADDLPAQGRADNLKPRAAEVEQYGEQGAEMQCDVEGELMGRGKLIPAQQPPHNNEVSRTGDGDEFRQPLNNGKNHRLIDWQS
jgi:hypothetical protein